MANLGVARYMSIEENVAIRKQAYKAPPSKSQNFKKECVGRFETYMLLRCHSQGSLCPRTCPTSQNPHLHPTKRCNYQKNQCHTTEECYKVHDPIEELIRLGVVNHFVQNNQYGQG